MIRSFKNVTALVTGASSGIGKALARELAAQGANLILISRSTQLLEQEAEGLRSRFGVKVHIFSADLARLEKRLEFLAWVQKSGFTVDVLVNNAGLGHYGPFDKEDFEDARAMLDLNVHALVHLTRFFLPGMLERGTGGVLNVASMAGFQPIPYLSVYAATKAFVLHFSEALWAECKDGGVRVFCLCPGNTHTRFHQTAGIDKQRTFLCAPAAEVARFALKKFLKTNQPSAIYGFWNKLMVYAGKFSPRRLTVLMTGFIYRLRKSGSPET